MTTTIYLPMPEWQALAFLRNRAEAFQRLLTPAGNHLPCEVVLFDDSLFGFKQRENAVEIGRRVYPHGFAIVRFVVLGKLLNGMMTLQRQIVGTNDPQTDAPLWRISRDGLQTLSERVGNGDVEILVDQIFGGSDHEHNVDRCSAAHNAGPDRGYLEEGGFPAGLGGPTGFGGC